MRHIVLFSGGANSAVVAIVVAQQYPGDTILLHTPTYAEHPDADRFREDVSRFLGIPITVQEDGRSLWDVIKAEHCLPSHFIPFCTRVLKLEPLDRYLKLVEGDFTLYVGYGKDEWRRIQKQMTRFAVKGYKSKYPLFDMGWFSCEAKSILRESGLKLPEPYEHINHNNCLPCFKGGLGHFWTVWRFYPDYFQKAVDAEDSIGHTVDKNKSLRELSVEWSQGKRPKTATEDGIPCLCQT